MGHELSGHESQGRSGAIRAAGIRAAGAKQYFKSEDGDVDPDQGIGDACY
jgi:hypothetical protein